MIWVLVGVALVAGLVLGNLWGALVTRRYYRSSPAGRLLAKPGQVVEFYVRDDPESLRVLLVVEEISQSLNGPTTMTLVDAYTFTSRNRIPTEEAQDGS